MRRLFQCLSLSVAISLTALAQDVSHLKIRGIYGGSPVQPGEAGILEDFGVNAIFMHSGSLTQELVTMLKSQGAQVFAEYNTMHYAKYLETHPEAAPVGPDGKVSPPPEGWQGVCPNHPGYRQNRMQTFRELLERLDIDGIWLDYHHAHSSWERAEPIMPDTCFCSRCLEAFTRETGIELPESSAEETSAQLLGPHYQAWTQWRCDLFTDWVREFKDIIGSVKPGVLLGTFHNPWSDEDYQGARIHKLAIDLKAQARYIDVFSPMPYHARFGHSENPGWISRQVKWLGKYLGLEGRPGEEIKIWPIVQLSDWGEKVPASQVREILHEGMQRPATGVMVFAWGSLRKQPEKVEEMKRFYLSVSDR